VSDSRFYVYEHWRPDTDVCFYVGKGTGDRANRFKRNAGYDAVVSFLSALGMCVEVRMVESGLTAISALTMEEQRIKFWRSSGVTLTNRDNGGRGSGKVVSAESREKIRRANLGKVASEETKAKMRAAHAARKAAGYKKPPRIGYTHSEETRKKISESNRGKPVLEKTKHKLRVANLGKKASAETRAKMGAAHARRTAPYIAPFPKGSKRSPETKAKMSKAQKGHLVSKHTREKLAKIAKATPKQRGSNGQFRSTVSS
jgi:hypothetical protein